MQEYSFTIEAILNGVRIDKALCSLIENVSRSRIQAAIKNGYLQINNAIISDSSHKVKENDHIKLQLIEEESAAAPLAKSDIKFDIVYEDDDIIIIDKPVGLTVHPGAGNQQNTLVNALLYHDGDNLSDVGGASRPGIVHRLDKDTSGLMVVAKNNNAHMILAKQIESRELVRQYKALIWGIMNPLSGSINMNIERSSKDHKKMSVTKSGGKHAITHYNTEKIFLKGLMSLVSCTLETGRTHQIRVHLSNSGHSVVGDQAYGNNSRKVSTLPLGLKEECAKLKRQALHSCYIRITHPVTNETIEFESKLPEDISHLIELME